MNHELQEKARKCVLDVLKEHNNEFTYEAVMQMDYIEQCLNGTYIPHNISLIMI